jgi:hypothetical protein
MSNLTLKKTDYKSLTDLKLGGYQTRKLGHNTNVQRISDTYVIDYHNNAIAEVGVWMVAITNAGWGTSTTRNRLNIILRDNGIPAAVFQKDYAQYLRFGGSVYPFGGTTVFDMVAGEWTLATEKGM